MVLYKHRNCAVDKTIDTVHIATGPNLESRAVSDIKKEELFTNETT